MKIFYRYSFNQGSINEMKDSPSKIHHTLHFLATKFTNKHKKQRKRRKQNKMWDETFAGPKPEHGLGRLRKKITAQPIDIKGVGEGSSSKTMPAATAGSPGTPTTPGSARKENVWRSVFHPGSNIATKGRGTNLFDTPSHPNSPTVYDWLYSDDTKSQHR